MRAPFFVCKDETGWMVTQQFSPFKTFEGFDSAGDAIDHAYRNWPWWP